MKGKTGASFAGGQSGISPFPRKKDMLKQAVSSKANVG